MRIIAGILFYLIVVMLLTIKTLYDDNNHFGIEMTFPRAFFIANLTISIISVISAILIVLLRIMITGKI